MLIGNDIARFTWIARARLCRLEIQMRPLGSRSRNLKQAWPSIVRELGLGPCRMTLKNLDIVAKLCLEKSMQ